MTPSNRLLLIGQAPGPNTDPLNPLYPSPRSSAPGRLCSIMGLNPEDYLALFDRANLLYTFPGRSGPRDDRFPRREARVAADAMKPLLRGRSVVFIGRNVANAFGHPADTLEFHEWSLEPRWAFHMACVPHPSGRNHWYRKLGHEEAARAFWETIVKKMYPQSGKVLSFVGG